MMVEALHYMRIHIWRGKRLNLIAGALDTHRRQDNPRALFSFYIRPAFRYFSPSKASFAFANIAACSADLPTDTRLIKASCCSGVPEHITVKYAINRWKT